jgi:hypothetical protein
MTLDNVLIFNFGMMTGILFSILAHQLGKYFGKRKAMKKFTRDNPTECSRWMQKNPDKVDAILKRRFEKP